MPESDAGTTHPSRRSTRSWVLYDLANTTFALGVVGLYFPAWLTDRGLADSVLSLAEATAGVVVIFLAPWVGARSDALGRRVPTLIGTTIITVAATSVLASGPVWLSVVALSVALVAFNTGSVVYDALLPDVSTSLTRGRVSGLGVGFGYIGSALALGIGVVTFDVFGAGYPATFLALAGAFLFFALPTFAFVEEPPRPSLPPPGMADLLRRLARSWRLAATFPGVVRFLVGRFLYTDAINTLVGGFLAIYAIGELGLDESQVRALLATAIAAAIPGAFLAGRAVSRFGALTVLRAAMVGWLVALGAGVYAGVSGELTVAWAIGPLGGMALGTTWSADRVLMADLSPSIHLGEMYGLYATVGRFATIVGPLVWALIVDGLGLARTWALGALGVFVLAALIVLRGLERTPGIARG